MAITEGANDLPVVASVKFSGVADAAATSALLWVPRSLAAGDGLAGKYVQGAGLYGWNGATADRLLVDASKNLKIAFYDAAGAALLISANPGVINLTQVNGVALLAGAGNTGTGSPRVTIASDQAVLPFKVDQTTPGTTDRVTVGGIATPEVQLTVSTSPAYTANDAVGGKMSFTNAVRVSGGSGVIQSVRIVDQANQKAAMDIVFFEADPATTITDNAALDVSDADMDDIIGFVSLAASDYISFADNAVAFKYGLGIPFKLATGTTLYAAMLTRGTPTFAATTDVWVQVGLLQD